MNAQIFSFCAMQPQDYDSLIELWQAAGLPYRPQGRDSREKLLTELQNPQERFILAYAENRLAGTILVSHDGRKGWLNRLAVHPDFRHQGLAARLIEQAEQFLAQAGITVYACLIEDWNEPSMQLFSRQGYTRHDDIIYFVKKQSAES
ncbi:MAG TPA: GNAT family N-acetyltransferase [Candidatus Cloacimonadota bacterium]|nr:GNAT family N-acetyltransferase [Candidatus Cloacimonadota bacterium]